MKNKKITLDLVALSEHGGLITDVCERLSGKGQKKFAKELAAWLRTETLTGFMEKNGIVSCIDDLVVLVGDRMITTTDRTFSHEKLGLDKTELEIAREITGNSNLSADEAMMALIASGKLPTLGEFIQKAHQAGSGWHLTFIEVEVEGQKKVASVNAFWAGGVLYLHWFWFVPTYGWNADGRLLLASGN